MKRPLSTLLAVVSATGVVSVAGQPIRDARVFRAGIELTSVAATVVDRDGRLVTGLTRDDFDVFEDGTRQPITQFTNERVPLSLGVLLDTSDSMHGQRLAEARVAVERFLFELLDPADEFFLVAFNHVPRVLTTWTRDRQLIGRTLEALIPAGATAAYDAVLAALPLFETRERPRAAMLIISDGADTASETAIRDLRSALLRTDAFVYAIAIDPPGALAINARVNVQALREITGQSGGRTEVIHTPEDLVAATQRIAEELNSQYLLGYTPPKRADGKYHSIRVRVRGTDYRVRARNGYVAEVPVPGS
jgi:Ca-activated chloride channel family protein